MWFVAGVKEKKLGERNLKSGWKKSRNMERAPGVVRGGGWALGGRTAEQSLFDSSCPDLPSSSQLINFYLNNWTRSQQDRLLRNVSKTNSEGLITFHHSTSDLIISQVKTDGNVIFLGGNCERLWNAQIQLTKNMNLKCESNRTTLDVDPDHRNALFCSLASTYSQPKWYSQTLEVQATWTLNTMDFVTLIFWSVNFVNACHQ